MILPRVTAIIGGFAERLDRAIARSYGPKVIEHAPAERRELPPTGPRPTPLNAPFATERQRRC
jgi:hypothetical protein